VSTVSSGASGPSRSGNLATDVLVVFGLLALGIGYGVLEHPAVWTLSDAIWLAFLQVMGGLLASFVVAMLLIHVMSLVSRLYRNKPAKRPNPIFLAIVIGSSGPVVLVADTALTTVLGGTLMGVALFITLLVIVLTPVDSALPAPLGVIDASGLRSTLVAAVPIYATLLVANQFIWAQTLDPSFFGDEASLRDIGLLPLWHFTDALPFVDVDDTLNWPEPLDYSSAQVGVTLLLAKLCAVLGVAELIKDSVKAFRSGGSGSST